MYLLARPFAWLMLIMAAACGSNAFAITLWTENAENGYGQVIDGTHASYPLIQSAVVGEGNNAFHLAHPTTTDNWFVVDETLTIQPDTKLFFLSRLGYATVGQVARVQMSTDGGNTWPTNIYTQAGSGGQGEVDFSFKQFGLGSYANQNVRFRFYYDRLSGSFYDQTSSGVGWYVDDIQIGSEYQKTAWSIGNPSAHAQQYMEYINRARADATVEGQRLRYETNSDIQNAYNFFNIDGQDIVDQFAESVNNGYLDLHAQPLSFQADLQQAAQLHTQDMFDHQLQQHISSSNPPAPFQSSYTLSQRLGAIGYDGNGFAENVYSYSKSVAHGHAGFDVDWGPDNPSDPNYNPNFAGQGMQNPAGHRRNLHDGDYNEIGIGVINGTNGSVGPQLVTQDFGLRNTFTYVTGVVYDDLNLNSFYDIGEGKSGVRIDVDGSLFYAISSPSGGYSVPVQQDGTYPVTFSGGGFQSFSTTASILNSKNYKIDYLVSPLVPLAGDYNKDGTVDAADYVVWSKGATTGTYATWRANFRESNNGAGGGVGAAVIIGANVYGPDDSSTVPEPAFLAQIAIWLIIGFAGARRRRVEM